MLIIAAPTPHAHINYNAVGYGNLTFPAEKYDYVERHMEIARRRAHERPGPATSSVLTLCGDGIGFGRPVYNHRLATQGTLIQVDDIT